MAVEFQFSLLERLCGTQGAKNVITCSINEFLKKHTTCKHLKPVEQVRVVSAHLKLTNYPLLYSTILDYVLDLPPDFSNPETIESICLPENFFVKKLQDQIGLVAQKQFEPYEVLGIFWGFWATITEFEETVNPENLEDIRNQNSFLVDVENEIPLYIDPTHEICGSKFRYLNDCRVRINRDITELDEKRLNVEFVQANVRGFPFIFLICCEPIKKGENLWTFYGNQFIC